jgi:hypothetical protein
LEQAALAQIQDSLAELHHELERERQQREALERQLEAEQARCVEVQTTNAQIHAALEQEREQARQALAAKDAELQRLQQMLQRAGDGVASPVAMSRLDVPPAMVAPIPHILQCQTGTYTCTCGGGCKCRFCMQLLPASGTNLCGKQMPPVVPDSQFPQD